MIHTSSKPSMPAAGIALETSIPGETSPIDGSSINVETISTLLGDASTPVDGKTPMDRSISRYAAKQLASAKKAQKAVSLPHDRPDARISRKLTIVKSNEELLLTCAKTGIICTLSVPAVRGKTLIYHSPFTSMANVRGIIQEGTTYLSRLETQILAGLLITLLEEYELLSKHDIEHTSGATKNAILRNAGIETLVYALTTIEVLTNNANAVYVPRLSLALEEVTKQHDIQSRLSRWVSLVIESVSAPDTSYWDDNKKPEKIIFDSMKRVKGVNKQVSLEAIAKTTFFQDKKAAKALILAMRCSQKMKGFLTTIFTADNLLKADPMMVGRLTKKLDGAEDQVNAQKIIALLKKDRSILIEQLDDGLDDLDDPFTTQANKPAERSEALLSNQSVNEQTIDSDSGEDKEEIGFKAVIIGQFLTKPEEPDFSHLPFLEKIKAKREWVIQQNLLKAGKNPNDGFSPEKQTIIPPTYVPSADKLKIAGE